MMYWKTLGNDVNSFGRGHLQLSLDKILPVVYHLNNSVVSKDQGVFATSKCLEFQQNPQYLSWSLNRQTSFKQFSQLSQWRTNGQSISKGLTNLTSSVHQHTLNVHSVVLCTWMLYSSLVQRSKSLRLSIGGKTMLVMDWTAKKLWSDASKHPCTGWGLADRATCKCDGLKKTTLTTLILSVPCPDHPQRLASKILDLRKARRRFLT